MRKFWGYYSNGMYRVGCNGGTVYVYDAQEKEIAKFKDFPNTYRAAFMPNRNVIAVKSTAGCIGFYDLDTLTRIKKHVITRMGCQDEGFAFSPDGRFFYNIEKPVSNCETQLGIYETDHFEKINTLFADRKDIVLSHIEFDAESDVCYVLGFMRSQNTGVFHHGFIGILDADNADISGIKELEHAQYDYANAYKSWESEGFTEKSLEWNSTLKSLNTITPVSLKSIYNSL